jgi:hypothetical protein
LIELREHLRIVIPPVENFTGFKVLGRVVYERCSGTNLSTCLIFTVERIDVLDELTVEKVEGNVLRAYSGAFTAVGATACNVECSDDVEHLLFEAVRGRFIFNAGFGVVKYAFFAGASGASVTASVATDATGEFALPECESFVGSHCFELCYLVETVGGDNLAFFTEKLVVSNVLFTLAVYTTFSEYVCLVNRLNSVVKSINLYTVRFGIDRNNTVTN